MARGAQGMAWVVLCLAFISCAKSVLYKIGDTLDFCSDMYIYPETGCVYLGECESGSSYYCAIQVEEITDEELVRIAKENSFRMRKGKAKI